MIIEQLQDKDNLTESEKQIADYLLDETNMIEHLTSTELAKAAYTSQSTVVRFYQKMGFQSYREFMTILAIERQDYLSSGNIFDGDPFYKFTSYDITKDIITKLFQNALVDGSIVLDRNTVTRVCNRMINTPTIDIYAFGLAEPIGLQLQKGLLVLNKHVTLQNDMNEFYLSTIKNPKNHMALFLSICQNESHIIDIAKTINDLQIYCVSIAHSKDSLLAQYCQDTLYVGKTTNNTTLDDILSIIINLYISFILSSLVTAKNYNILDKY